MPSPNKLIILGVCFVLLLGAAAFIYKDDLPFLSSSEPKRELKPALEKSPTKNLNPAAQTKQAVPQPQVKAADSAFAIPEPSSLYKSPETVREITQLRANLEKVTLEEQIAQKEANLAKLQSPVLVPSAVIPVEKVIDDLPKRLAPPTAVPQPRKNRIIAIQGIDGENVAMLSTANGERKLRKGDNFGGGKIEAITSAGVIIRIGKKTRTITVEE